MKGNKYIKRVRVDSRQLDSGMIGTKVYVTEGEVVNGIMPVERLVRDATFLKTIPKQWIQQLKDWWRNILLMVSKSYK
ncbi:hypothetical protein QDT92_005482 [Klebsiella pneumoniae]|uniref:hypothetical protein n=1 Tax=Klebsiella pneumoniae TaxID=573 RepID=UPI001D0EF20F|nr:hypothetical protein [Klebsiella pneumoniae]MCL0547256.1 hypothetical protein [Klebsiella pneumoniae]UNS73766.1 hypothetical protein MOQ71_20180 [Klebsiella pneumoniae]UNS77954.1 hypothetical protein MOQ71_29280 [Klebsiella pneumoniae]UNS85066.1 hypothetical protein MOQ73_20350 [Klebsiella pneumoniae]UNS89466.1 hypothetical protein MOQ73_28845 [Klebsiella pneumoniae]